MNMRRCLEEFGQYSDRKICGRNKGHEGEHLGPLLGSNAAQAYRELRLMRLELLELREAIEELSESKDIQGQRCLALARAAVEDEREIEKLRTALEKIRKDAYAASGATRDESGYLTDIGMTATEALKEEKEGEEDK